MITLPVIPSKYDATQWSDDPEFVGPALYKGFPDAFQFFAELVMVRLSRRFDFVMIMGRIARAANLQVEESELSSNHPVYFEVTGSMYHYAISVWANRVTIEVNRKVDGDRYELLSVMFPSNQEELTRALSTIAFDVR